MENLKNRTLEEILAIRDQVAQMGANDHEIPSINQIVESVQRGELSEDEALIQARKILERKADYH